MPVVSFRSRRPAYESSATPLWRPVTPQKLSVLCSVRDEGGGIEFFPRLRDAFVLRAVFEFLDDAVGVDGQRLHRCAL